MRRAGVLKSEECVHVLMPVCAGLAGAVILK